MEVVSEVDLATCLAKIWKVNLEKYATTLNKHENLLNLQKASTCDNWILFVKLQVSKP